MSFRGRDLSKGLGHQGLGIVDWRLREDLTLGLRGWVGTQALPAVAVKVAGGGESSGGGNCGW